MNHLHFTAENHLQYTIGGRRWGTRQNPIEPYCVQIGKVTVPLMPFAEELKSVAWTIRHQLGRNLVLMLSGGTDSELALRAFLAIGFTPQCVCIRFPNGENAADVKEAMEICACLNAPLRLIDLDIKDFFYSGQAKAFGDPIACCQITYLMVYHTILALGQPAVMGGEVVLTRHVPATHQHEALQTSFWYYSFRENEDASAMRFSHHHGIPLVNEFFSYTPELLASYLIDPQIQELTVERFNYKLTSVSTKNQVLNRLWPELRPKKKTHGFERLLAFNLECYKELARDQVRRLQPSLDGIPLPQLYQQLGIDL